RRRLLRDRPEDVAAHDPRAREPHAVEVLLDRPYGVWVVLDEDGAGSSARERLDPERARAGEEVEHLRVVDRPDEVEDVLADAIGGRPRVEPARRYALLPLPRHRDHEDGRRLGRARP